MKPLQLIIALAGVCGCSLVAWRSYQCGYRDGAQAALSPISYGVTITAAVETSDMRFQYLTFQGRTNFKMLISDPLPLHVKKGETFKVWTVSRPTVVECNP